MVGTRSGATTSLNEDGNETTGAQRLVATNRRTNVDAQPGATSSQQDVVTRTEFNEMMKELLESRRQLNEQIQTNITLMNRLANQPRENVRESPARNSLSEGSHSSDQQLGSGRNGENAAGNAAGTEQAGRATAGREPFMPAVHNNARRVASGHNVTTGHVASGHNATTGHVTAGRDTFVLPGNQTTSRAYATEPGISAQRPSSEMEAMVCNDPIFLEFV